MNGYVSDCIPYYTPNTALLYRYNYDLKAIIKELPLLTDDYTQSGNGYEKIKAISQNQPLQEIAKQISDLLSFAVYAFEEGYSEYWNSVKAMSSKVSEEFADSLEKDRIQNQDNLLQEFGHMALTILSDYVDIPYFYYPYVLTLKIEKEKNSALEIKLREYYVQFISTTCEQISRIINDPNWNL